MSDERIHVVLVDDHDAVASGMARLLREEPRLRVIATLRRVSDLRYLGIGYDVCVLDLVGVGEADELVGLMREVPVVVYTAATDWHVRVAAWVCGARFVLGKDIGAVPLADAVWDAVYRPHDIRPQLAQALLDAIERCGVESSPRLLDVLAEVAASGRVPRILARLGIDEARYVADIEALRESCARAGLGKLEVLGPADLAVPGTAAPDPRATTTLPPPPEAADLTPREAEVLRELALGYPPTAVADRLHIAESSVKTHIMNAMAKYGINRHRESAVQVLFAMYMTGRRPDQDRLRARLNGLRPG
jgi:DNA-binding NarL/FixJ family response regulator